MNRRKPRVVLGTTHDQTVAVSVNVGNGIGANAAGNTDGDPIFTVAEADELRAGLALFDNGVASRDAAIVLSESSQVAIANRNEQVELLKSVLYQVRDIALGIGRTNPSQGPGFLGFEVVQSKTSGNQRPRVVIPTSFVGLMALARRVDTRMSDISDGFSPLFPNGSSAAYDGIAYDSAAEASLINPVVIAAGGFSDTARMDAEAASTKRQQAADALVSLRTRLAEIRDTAFGRLGPGNYERLGELGFEVQSTATQNQGTGVISDPPAEDPPAEDPPAEDPPAEDPPA